MSGNGAITAEAQQPLPSTGTTAMYALRAQRKRNRLGDMEWFDAAYRVYVVGLFGAIALAWLSDRVGDEQLSAEQAVNVLRHGPAILGMVAVLAVVAGLRSGSQGGPLALEAADVTYVMLAPVSRRAALMRPAVQRVRSAAFMGGIVAAALAQLAGRRLPGTPIAWFFGGSLFGVIIAALWVGSALVAHVARMPLLATTLAGGVLIGWQAAAIARDIPGPGNLVGSLGLWGWRQRPIDWIAIVATVALVATGLVLVARTSLDALARRSSLVAQLRFAVTMQDLRTVILLRRQLSYEHTRSRPWFRLPLHHDGHAVWRRGWHSLLRLPTGRLVRMAALAIAAGACQVAVVHQMTPAVFGTLIAIFILGLEVMEPLSQEIDQPDRNASFPLDRGHLHVRHLAAPAVLLVPFGLLAGATAVVLDIITTDGQRIGPSIAVAAVLALPTVFAGAAGGTVSIVRDAPDPLSTKSQEAFMPPEMAGLTNVLQTVLPLIVPLVGALSVLAVRQAIPDGATAAISAASRMALGLVLLVGAVTAWVRHRDRIRAKIRQFMAEGKAQTTQQRSTR
ncbi:MAG: hypothetical protein WD023_05085 [Ilumatobacteraceae bacterium]